MPEARRLRNAFYQSNPDPRFVHYTNADAALGIIDKKRLWLRNTTSMIDYREVHHGFTLLLEWFNTGENRSSFLQAFDGVQPGAAAEAIKLFDDNWKRADIAVHTQTYIGSVSEHDPAEDEHGRLSMWRAFGVNASARVALVFRVPSFSGAIEFLRCNFSPVAYLDSNRAHAIFAEVVQNALAQQEFLKTLRITKLDIFVVRRGCDVR